MNWGSILQLIFGLYGMEQSDKQIIDSGGVATTPPIQVGTDQSKPLYARAQLSTDKTFGGTGAVFPP